MNDEILLKSVKQAKVKGLNAKLVEQFVGTKATINTTRKEDKLFFSSIAIEFDSNTKLPSVDQIEYVVYWVRPIEDKNVRIVGLAWSKKGEVVYFLGTIFPPL